jgi:predicted O-methyltransferase YrrM
MKNSSLGIKDEIYDYMLAISLREPPLLQELRVETGEMSEGIMQISPEQGQFMALLVKLTGARRYLEVGTFTGYSSLVVALALPEEGRILACDVSEEYTSVARRYWRDAGVAHKIDLRLAPASDTLRREIESGAEGSYDFAFIDADKENYETYYEQCLSLLRPGGLLAIDNVLWSGKPADPGADDDMTVAIRSINERVHKDDRVDISLLPISDGLTLAYKR